jgi:2-keto-3-deoxy-L-rhamnonate aldolase RhmA
MNGQALIAALQRNQRVYGTCIISPSPHWPHVIQTLKLDFVFIDIEHTAIDRLTLAWMCQTYAALNLAPIVRISQPDPYLAGITLEAGASGIVAPYVETAGEVQALRGAVKWRPLRGHLLQDILAGQAKPDPALLSYLTRSNASNLLIININNPAALDEILNVPQIDVILVSPQDLSLSLGIPEQYDHPLFVETIRAIIVKARSRGVGVGIYFSNGLASQIEWAKAGANFIVHNSDLTLFSQVMATDLATVRAALGDTPARQSIEF